MARVTIIDPENDSRWESFVEKHPFGWISHLSGWKKVLEGTYAHMKGHYFVLEDRNTMTIVAALPLYVVKSAIKGNRLVSIPFATLSDPLVDNEEQFELLFEEALSVFKERNCCFCEIRTINSKDYLKKTRLGEVNHFKHHFITLNDNINIVQKKFHKTCVRQRISRAIKSNLDIEIASDIDRLKEFYRLHLITRKRTGRPAMPYRFFVNLWHAFQPKGQMTLLLTKKRTETIAALINFKYRGRVSAEFAASDDKYFDLSPNHYLFWESIRMAHQEGYECFDFGRTSPTNKSLMDFKNRWGTEVVDLPQFIFPPSYASEFESLGDDWKFKAAEKFCRVAPNAFQRLFGEFCYRHLG